MRDPVRHFWLGLLLVFVVFLLLVCGGIADTPTIGEFR